MQFFAVLLLVFMVFYICEYVFVTIPKRIYYTCQYWYQRSKITSYEERKWLDYEFTARRMDPHW